MIARAAADIVPVSAAVLPVSGFSPVTDKGVCQWWATLTTTLQFVSSVQEAALHALLLQTALRA